MRTIGKISGFRPKRWPKDFSKSLSKVIFGVFGRFCWNQRKWLFPIAVIFLVFTALDLYAAPPFKDITEKPKLFPLQSDEIITRGFSGDAATAAEGRKSGSGLLGGPMILGSLISTPAQASVDLSADDALEDSDLQLIQDSSIVSFANPSGTAYFLEFRREVVNYIVKQGDVPEKIAESFGINSDTLLWANGLRDGDIIKPGQELLILPINGVRIKAGAKDTIDSLAKKYNGDKMEIIAFNNLSLDGMIAAGDYLIIPDGEMPPPPKPKTKPGPLAPKYAQSTIGAGWLILPTSGRSWGKVHASNGVDVAASCGTPIYAAAAGKIILSDGVGYNGGYGKYIKIQHPNGVVTLYSHESKLLVSEGEQVSQGQLIGLMGTTGRSTGCHLHWEVRGAKNPLAGRAGNI